MPAAPRPPLNASGSGREDAPLLARSGGAGGGSGGGDDDDDDDVAITVAPSVATAPSAAAAGGGEAGASVGEAGASAAASSPPSPPSSPRPRGTCRFCFESEPLDGPPAEPGNPLISPCLCSGGSRYVHRHCLSSWRQAQTRPDAAFRCEVCHFTYQFRRQWWAGVIGSRAAFAATYVLLVVAFVALLGCVPLLQGLWAAGGGGGGGSAAAGGGGGGGGGGGDAGGGGGPSPPPAPSPAPSPAPGPAPSPAPGPPGPVPAPAAMAAAASGLLLHAANGVVVLGLVGLLMSLCLLLARAWGVPLAAALAPEPCASPLCLWFCADCGGPGLGWAPFVECGAAGECGVALLALVAVAAVAAGVASAMSTLARAMRLVVDAALSRAQEMVENVHGGGGGGDGDVDDGLRRGGGGGGLATKA